MSKKKNHSKRSKRRRRPEPPPPPPSPSPFASVALGRTRLTRSKRTQRYIVEVIPGEYLGWIGRAGGLPRYAELRHGHGEFTAYYTNHDGTVGKPRTFTIPKPGPVSESVPPAWASRWDKASIAFWASQWIASRLQDNPAEDVLGLYSHLVKTLADHSELLARLRFDDCCRITTTIITKFLRAKRPSRVREGKAKAREKQQPTDSKSGRNKKNRRK
jgi:hypothetical protein